LILGCSNRIRASDDRLDHDLAQFGYLNLTLSLRVVENTQNIVDIFKSHHIKTGYFFVSLKRAYQSKCKLYVSIIPARKL
jgi:hypothetical protein